MINTEEAKLYEIPYSIPHSLFVGDYKYGIILDHDFDYYVDIQKKLGSDFDFSIIKKLFIFLDEYHVWVAGGLVRKLICEQLITKENTDIDIWSPVPDNVQVELGNYIGWPKKTTPWAFHLDYEGHQVQIIRKKFANVRFCLSYFDWTCCKLALLPNGHIISNGEWGYWSEMIELNPRRRLGDVKFVDSQWLNNPVVDAREGLLKLSLAGEPKVIHPNRFVKYLKQGYFPECRNTKLLLDQYLEHGEDYKNWSSKAIPSIKLSTDKNSSYGMGASAIQGHQQAVWRRRNEHPVWHNPLINHGAVLANEMQLQGLNPAELMNEQANAIGVMEGLGQQANQQGVANDMWQAAAVAPPRVAPPPPRRNILDEIFGR